MNKFLMKKIFSVLVLIFFILQVGCCKQIYKEDADKYMFLIKMKQVVGNDVKIVNSLNRVEAQLAYLELPLKSDKTSKIIELLKKDGWTYKGAGIGSETYCQGVNNSINIVRPTSKTVTTFKGGDLYVTDYNKDIVSYSYNKSGLDICK
ncbi:MULTISPECIES: hypothetical protein [Acinetobacter calcoaceticus/baumannii complex]|nr:hypothetical protein [Acinetobacter baumannii]MBR7718327.1 hypothetical protein [Acinetobacter nosocomialis]EHU1360584.1 hypothetical protein [Acinetobacter baumannii]ELX04286.1 hypothetical protein ACINNAV57_1297 [Acinetobacter baumannii Naval-57]KAF0600004.1 hypothetical protein AB71190_03237 [Acinetobacter baumannii]KGF59309.1 hypothetical protein LH92_05325 [Acinetobacter baumannii]